MDKQGALESTMLHPEECLFNGESEAGLGYYCGPQTGARREETLRGQEGAGAYFRISVMVSFRSFPWKGREPVSISNCRRQGSIQALVPISHAPHLLPRKPLSSIPRILAGLLEVHLDQNCVCPSPVCQSEHQEQY